MSNYTNGVEKVLAQTEVTEKLAKPNGFESALNDDLVKANSYFKQSHDATRTKNENSTELLDKILENSLVTLSDELQEPPICLEILGPKGSSIIGTLGNFLAIIGKAKSRKNFLVSLLLSAFILRNVLMDRIQCILSKDKFKALHFDTEQSTYHV